ncbi:hypothetical protein KBAHV46_05140 [Aeromonas hydrophila]|nr:hypothetical protein KBAHV27_05120 [Aeromonas hydrophila]CAD7507858.1 hypothetical protein KBAHV46_05140 [Aeromonas hydrophila]
MPCSPASKWRLPLMVCTFQCTMLLSLSSVPTHPLTQLAAMILNTTNDNNYYLTYVSGEHKG